MQEMNINTPGVATQQEQKQAQYELCGLCLQANARNQSGFSYAGGGRICWMCWRLAAAAWKEAFGDLEVKSEMEGDPHATQEDLEGARDFCRCGADIGYCGLGSH